MSRPAWLLLWLLPLALAPSADVLAGSSTGVRAVPGIKRCALLIGVDDYARARKLNYCGADAHSLGEQLVAAGFPRNHVVFLHDKADQTKYRPVKSNIEDQLNLLLGLVQKDDLVVVSFSGHGVYLDGKSYLCPADAQLDDPSTLVSLDSVYERLQQSAASLKLILVDACRDDPRPGGQRSATASRQTRRFAESLETPPRGILLLSSCAPGEISWEEEAFHHGVFMHYVLEGLKGQADLNRNQRVSLGELWVYVNDQTKTYVAERYSSLQRPTLKGNTFDDFDISFAGPEPTDLLATALRTAESIETDVAKSLAITTVAVVQRQMGDPAAGETFARAIEVVGQLTDPEARALALAAISHQQELAGDRTAAAATFREALAAARTVAAPVFRSYTLARCAAQQRRSSPDVAKTWTEALEIAQGLPPTESSRDALLLAIAFRQSSSSIAAALKAISLVPLGGANSRSRLLGNVMLTIVGSRRPEDLLRRLGEDDSARPGLDEWCSAVDQVCRTLARRGTADGDELRAGLKRSREMADKISDVAERVIALALVGWAETRFGDDQKGRELFQKAVSLAEPLDDEPRQGVLWDVVVAQGHADAFVDALKTARLINDETHRETALVNVVFATKQLAISPKKDALLNEILSQMKDNVHLKQHILAILAHDLFLMGRHTEAKETLMRALEASPVEKGKACLLSSLDLCELARNGCADVLIESIDPCVNNEDRVTMLREVARGLLQVRGIIPVVETEGDDTGKEH